MSDTVHGASWPLPSPVAVATLSVREILPWLLFAALLVGRRLAMRLGGWHAALIAIGGYLVIMLVAMVLMPHDNEVPDGFPASILYDFRRASFLTQFTVWAVLGVVLAYLVTRLARSDAMTLRRRLVDVRG